MESEKELIKEYEAELKKKHAGTYSVFQYKLWAEMYAKQAHTSLDQPPAVAMFNREKPKGSHGQNDVMVSVIDKLCTALTPTPDKGKALSPIKTAELRSTYLRQLSELKTLYDNGILNMEEYEEQRVELVELMRQLKK